MTLWIGIVVQWQSPVVERRVARIARVRRQLAALERAHTVHPHLTAAVHEAGVDPRRHVVHLQHTHSVTSRGETGYYLHEL